MTFVSSAVPEMLESPKIKDSSSDLDKAPL